MFALRRTSNGPARARAAGFTVVELLAVLAAVALLLGMLLPALNQARSEARDLVCKSNLKGLMSGMVAYAAANGEAVVPSYNMRGITGGRANPLDGWAPILDQGGYALGNDTLAGNPFVCPETADFPGLAATNRGGNADDPWGYMDWPAVITFTGTFATTIPQRGFNRIIRTSYWINGENPIGAPREVHSGVYFTGSVGYGPDPQGRYLQTSYFVQFRSPERLVALADGVFAGNQHATRRGQVGLRVGYRHPDGPGSANVGFADGHADAIASDRFPRAADQGMPVDEIRRENSGSRPTLYADPAAILERAP